MQSNSIRLRLNRSEVKTFCNRGQLTETIIFPSGKWSYGLLSVKGDKIEAIISENQCSIYLPDTMSKDWDKNEKVGFKETISLDDHNDLVILIEKDFKCLDPRGEDESDNYPNPKSI